MKSTERASRLHYRREIILSDLYADAHFENSNLTELKQIEMDLNKIKPRAKLLSSGKVQLRLSRLQVPLLKAALERLIGELEMRTCRGRLPLSFRNAQDWTYKGLVTEVYTKHFRDLSLSNKEIKISLTQSQACALWHLQNEQFDKDSVNSPLLSAVYYDLHRVITNA